MGGELGIVYGKGLESIVPDQLPRKSSVKEASGGGRSWIGASSRLLS